LGYYTSALSPFYYEKYDRAYSLDIDRLGLVRAARRSDPHGCRSWSPSSWDPRNQFRHALCARMAGRSTMTERTGGFARGSIYHGNIATWRSASSKLTAQGQISVPAEVRRKLGLAPGSVIEWEEDVACGRPPRGAHSSEEIHAVLFPDGAPRKSLGELKAGLRRAVAKAACAPLTLTSSFAFLRATIHRTNCAAEAFVAKAPGFPTSSSSR